MYFDVFTLSALVDEFMDTLVGGRVQDSIDTDETGLGLEIYANRQRQYLYLSADNLAPRVHLMGEKLRRGITKPRQLGLVFRSYVEDGLVTHVSQPAWERILQIDIDGPKGPVTVIVEPMQRRSNILLVQNGIIVDCMRRVGPEDNRYRLSLPAHAYVPPPPQTDKLDPKAVSVEDLDALMDANTDPKRRAHHLLSASVLGVSPLLGKEIVLRACGDSSAKVGDVSVEGLFDALQALMQPLFRREWQPGIAQVDGLVEAFSVYPLESLSGWEPVESISAALTAFYGPPVGDDAYDAAKKPIHALIQQTKGDLKAKLASLERSLTDESERDHLRQSGELVLAYQYMLQKGATELKAQYDPEGPELVIPLDPKLTPLENAQRYFSRYDKAKRALEDVPELVESTRHEIDFLDQLATDLDMALNWPEIDEVQQALQSRGYWRGKRVGRMGGGKSAPMRYVTPDGFVIWAGRNSRQNDLVTFDKGSSDDFWLHARDVPGAHVIIKYDGRTIPEEVIERAAEIAAYYSARRSEGRVIVDVTRRKYVKKINGAGPGMVTYRNETTRTVAPRSLDEKH